MADEDLVMSPEKIKGLMLNNGCEVSIPATFEPPVRKSRATIPEIQSLQKYYSTVLLT